MATLRRSKNYKSKYPRGGKQVETNKTNRKTDITRFTEGQTYGKTRPNNGTTQDNRKHKV